MNALAPLVDLCGIALKANGRVDQVKQDRLAGAGITDHLLRRRQESIDPGDVVSIHYTAGTTASPHGAELTPLNLVTNAFAAGEGMRLTRRDRLCVPVPFFRNKGAYLVGRVRTSEGSMPLVLPIVHDDQGIRVDAALTTADEVSVVFSFTRSYFHVEMECPRAMVEFLR